MEGAQSDGGPTGGALTTQPVVRFGPAGWSYADWAGIVYPRPRPRDFHPLDLLTTLFATIEVNLTFYRDVTARQVETWCRRVEARPDFRWSFKLHRGLSHGGAPPAPRELLDALRPFLPARDAGRLGALLLQFPWSFRASTEHAARLADLARTAGEAGWPLVIEVRHAGWRAAPPFPPVVCDQPPLPGNLAPDDALAAALGHFAAPLAPPAPLYLRLHGRNSAAWFAPDAGRDARYDYLYDDQELAGWRNRLRAAASRLPAGTAIHVIANNHFRGQAVVNALQLQRLWSGWSPQVPASLRAAYPRELQPFPERAAPPRATPAAGGPGRRRAGGGTEPTLF
jgi:uncharacterized protein YecE (DUF72 family)